MSSELHEQIEQARDHISQALEILAPVRALAHLAKEHSIVTQIDRIEEANDELGIEAVEYHFVVMLQREPADGFGLVDDGTMDTVLSCPKCNGWLRFDGRESAIMFLEDDRECWLCPEES
jgi:hypothetical protein